MPTQSDSTPTAHYLGMALLLESFAGTVFLPPALTGSSYPASGSWACYPLANFCSSLLGMQGGERGWSQFGCVTLYGPFLSLGLFPLVLKDSVELDGLSSSLRGCVCPAHACIPQCQAQSRCSVQNCRMSVRTPITCQAASAPEQTLGEWNKTPALRHLGGRNQCGSKSLECGANRCKTQVTENTVAAGEWLPCRIL